MRYLLTKEFTQINETTGTIQNASRIYSVEISDKAQAKSGFLLPPLNKISFANKTLYARCVEIEAVEICVVPFIVEAGIGASSSGSTSVFDTFDQSDVDDIFKP